MVVFEETAKLFTAFLYYRKFPSIKSSSTPKMFFPKPEKN